MTPAMLIYRIKICLTLFLVLTKYYFRNGQQASMLMCYTLITDKILSYICVCVTYTAEQKGHKQEVKVSGAAYKALCFDLEGDALWCVTNRVLEHLLIAVLIQY